LTTLSNALGPTAGAHCAPITRTAIPILASGYRVLVAEDNPINQRVVQQVLKRAGHEVTLADNGRLALERVQSGTYDLVLMDVQMPEMDGFEATAAIRAWESAQGRGRLPIVAMTASAMKGDLEACLGVGMDGYLTKPIDPVELDASVRRYVKSAAGVV
jgi:CheY-like chemotaxis protein